MSKYRTSRGAAGEAVEKAREDLPPVFIAGLGVRTAIGADIAAVSAAVRAGIANFRKHPSMVDKLGNPKTIASASYVPAELSGAQRLLELAVPAAEQAVAPIRDLPGTNPFRVIIGLPAPGAVSGMNCESLFKTEFEKLFGRSLSGIEFIAAGNAAGLMAVEQGLSVIRRNEAEFCLAGGADLAVRAEMFDWRSLIKSSGPDPDPWEVIYGEGAGFVLLASGKAAEKHNLEKFSTVLAAAAAIEKNLIRTDAVCVGEGLSAAVGEALRYLPADVQIDHIFCDLNVDPYRVDEIGFVAARYLEVLSDVNRVMPPAQFWGDVGAASGPLCICLAAALGRTGHALGPHTLVTASSDSGERSAVLLHTAVDRQT